MSVYYVYISVKTVLRQSNLKFLAKAALAFLPTGALLVFSNQPRC